MFTTGRAAQLDRDPQCSTLSHTSTLFPSHSSLQAAQLKQLLMSTSDRSPSTSAGLPVVSGGRINGFSAAQQAWLLASSQLGGLTLLQVGWVGWFSWVGWHCSHPLPPHPRELQALHSAGVAAEFRAPPAPPKLCTLQPALPLASSALPLLSAQGFTETYIKTAATASDASSSALGPQLSQLPASSVLDVSVRTGASSFASFKYSGSDSSSSSGGTAVVFSSYLQVFRRHRVLGLVLTVVQAWSAKCSAKHCAYFSSIY